MTKRVLTGTVFAVVMLAGVYFGGTVMSVLLSVALLLSVYEMNRAMHNKNMRPATVGSYCFCGMIIAAQFFRIGSANADHIALLAPVVGAMAAATELVLHGEIAADRLVSALFPILYPGMFYTILMACARISDRTTCALVLAAAFFTASINDMAALFTGMAFGRHKLSPILSPKKTIEGAIGGIVFGTLFTMFLPSILRLILFFDAEFQAGLSNMPPMWFFALLGLCASAASQLGDLTASMVKRYCGIKDYGNLLPGHGGIMDRLDGVLFCGAVCYIFFKIAGLG